jgi:hypothetical protein
MKQALQLLIKDITINRLIETSVTVIDKIYHNKYNNWNQRNNYR